jgi:hypothetical protein
MSIQKAKSFLMLFFSAFFITLCGAEAIFQLSVGDVNVDYWSIRFRKEAAAVEMYGEDIWQHGRRTLKTPFEPTSCSITPHERWLTHWVDVQCLAEDQLGQQWQYTSRYSNTTTPMFGMPFLIDVGPIREIKIIQQNPRVKGIGQ